MTGRVSWSFDFTSNPSLLAASEVLKNSNCSDMYYGDRWKIGIHLKLALKIDLFLRHPTWFKVLYLLENALRESTQLNSATKYSDGSSFANRATAKLFCHRRGASKARDHLPASSHAYKARPGMPDDTKYGPELLFKPADVDEASTTIYYPLINCAGYRQSLYFGGSKTVPSQWRWQLNKLDTATAFRQKSYRFWLPGRERDPIFLQKRFHYLSL